MSVVTVGVGKSAPMGGTTLAQLEDQLTKIRETYAAPDDAKICRTGHGSIYAFELIWVEK